MQGSQLIFPPSIWGGGWGGRRDSTAAASRSQQEDEQSHQTDGSVSPLLLSGPSPSTPMTRRQRKEAWQTGGQENIEVKGKVTPLITQTQIKYRLGRRAHLPDGFGQGKLSRAML